MYEGQEGHFKAIWLQPVRLPIYSCTLLNKHVIVLAEYLNGKDITVLNCMTKGNNLMAKNMVDSLQIETSLLIVPL